MHAHSYLSLFEKLALKGDYKGNWFQRLVAAQYMLAPDMDQSAVPAFEELARKFQRQFKFLQSKYQMDKTTDDPYKSMKHMTREINKQKDAGVRKPSVKVYDDDPNHPIFSQEFNTQLRWVHDIISHYYGQHAFSARGEFAAFNRHAKTLGPETDAVKALFTEVVAQTSCFYVYGDYVKQKVVILDDFDHPRVGLLAASSPLNAFFEVRGKELLPVEGFDIERFKAQFPDLFKELARQDSSGKARAPLASY